LSNLFRCGYSSCDEHRRNRELMLRQGRKGALQGFPAFLAFLALGIGTLFARTGAAACRDDVGAARAERMLMHCQRVNPSTQMSNAAMDCSTLSSLVQAFCGAPKGRPTLCGEYPAVVVSKYVGIPSDLERIAFTVAEDDQLSGAGIVTMRETFTLVTSMSTSVKSSKATVGAEQRAFAQHSTAASNGYKRYKAAVDSKSAGQLAQAPALLEAARTESSAAALIGESLVKHTAELREHERKLTAAVLSADAIASQVDMSAKDATNAGLVMDDALRSGAKAGADGDAMAQVKALRDQVTDVAKEAAKAATEATQLARKAHVLAAMGPGYNAQEAESEASAADDAQKKKVEELKRALAGLSGTSGNVCDRPMLERAWKASGRASTAHGAGLVPVVLHTLDAKTLGRVCPFLKATLGPSESASGTGAVAGAQNVDLGFVPFADLGLEILVLVATGPKCDSHGCGHTFFVNEGGGFTAASGSIVTPELAGFARRGVDIFAMLKDAEWKLKRTPGKPAELVFSRAR
jgi:hypothetical protein